ncbi:MAG: cell division protein FtsL [Terriglobales bacterium]
MATMAVSAGRTWGTPEIYFPKQIDNSRLVKVSDPARKREMAAFSLALGVLFIVFMAFCWQHYSAIEYGYRNEALRSQRELLLETQRQLTLQESSLRDPERIDVLAQQMGFQAPQAGQVVRLENPGGNEAGLPIIARAAAVSVISATQ